MYVPAWELLSDALGRVLPAPFAAAAATPAPAALAEDPNARSGQRRNCARRLPTARSQCVSTVLTVA